MLSVYRRHKRDCTAGHRHEQRTNEFEERKKGWKRCNCPIFASGTLQKVPNRKSTGQWEWERAREIAAAWDRAGNWEGITAAPAAPPPETEAERVRIDEAIAKFLREFEKDAAANTVKKYKLLLGKLQSYAVTKGYVMIDQWTPTDILDLRASWKVGPQTAAKNLSTIKSFFTFCVINQWLPASPAALIKRRRTRDSADTRNEQKLPFTDEELKRMYDACENEYGKQEITTRRKGTSLQKTESIARIARHQRKWTGQDLADFISISVYTGLRISDVATFHADRMKSTGEILLRTTKAGTHVYTWAPSWLQERIKIRAREVGQLIFGEHTTKDINVITDLWRRKLINLWELAKFPSEGPQKPTPHRFRHTFARILLSRPGVTVRDVAELLGNSEQMVRKHYAAWTPERQERLTRVLREAFAERPTPKTVAIR